MDKKFFLKFLKIDLFAVFPGWLAKGTEHNVVEESSGPKISATESV
jgi:hypothetical protein